MTKKVALWAAALVLFVSGVLPVVSMLVASIHSADGFSLSNYSQILSSRRQWFLLANSLKLAALVSFLTFIFGVPLGVLFGKSDIPFKKVFSLLFSIPILIPPYIMAVAWSDLVGSMAGAQSWLSGFLFGIGGTALVMSTVYLPIPMLLTMAFLRTVNPRLEEAARLCAPWPTVLKQITLPLIRPGLFLSAILVFVLGLGEFSIPSFLRYPVFSAESFTQFTAAYDFGAATAASTPLAFIALLFLMVETLLWKRRGQWTQERVTSRGFLEISLGTYRWPLAAATALLAWFIVLLPLIWLLKSSLEPGAYYQALEMGGEALFRSFVYASTGAFILSLCGFLSAYAIMNRSIWCWRMLDAMSLFLFAMPGTVIGIGLIGLWNTKWTGFIYSSVAMVILGYIARYYVLSSRIILTQLYLIPRSMEEAAEISGAAWPARMIHILVPLAKRGIAAAWLCTFIFCLRDTDLTMLVYPPGLETLPVRIFTLMANGTPELIASLCMLMVVVVTIPATILWSLKWTK